MPAVEPLCHLLGVSHTKFTKEENMLIEADLFIRICAELKEIFRSHYKYCYRLMKINSEPEEIMLEKSFTRLILSDILSTEDYSLQGIACYTDIHEDVIGELALGINTEPSAICLRKIIELHRTVRKELYAAIGKKIAAEYLLVE